MSFSNTIAQILTAATSNNDAIRALLTQNQGETLTASVGAVAYSDTDGLWSITSVLTGSVYTAIIKLPNQNINSLISFVEALNGTVPANVLMEVALAPIIDANNPQYGSPQAIR